MNTERLTDRQAYLRALEAIHSADERRDYKAVSEAAQELRCRAEALSRTLTRSDRSEPQATAPTPSPSSDGCQPAGMGVSTCRNGRRETQASREAHNHPNGDDPVL